LYQSRFPLGLAHHTPYLHISDLRLRGGRGNGERREREGRGEVEGKEVEGMGGCPFKLGILDLAVEEGREARSYLSHRKSVSLSLRPSVTLVDCAFT